MAGTVAGKGAAERPHKIDGMHLCFSGCAYLLKKRRKGVHKNTGDLGEERA
jgi:hypothetical protein